MADRERERERGVYLCLFVCMPREVMFDVCAYVRVTVGEGCICVSAINMEAGEKGSEGCLSICECAFAARVSIPCALSFFKKISTLR